MNRIFKRNNRSSKQEFVVIGLGRFGASLATTMAQEGHTVVGIDRDPTIVQHMANQLSQTITLDATDEVALKEAGIHHFNCAIVAIGSDFESNLLATVALKILEVPHVICKALTFRQRSILLQVGADQVVLPEIEGGQRLARDLTQPTMVSRLRLSEDVGLVERHVPEALNGQTLRQADLRGRFGVTIVVIYRGEEYFFSPPADFELSEGDTFVLIGSNSNLADFNATFLAAE